MYYDIVQQLDVPETCGDDLIERLAEQVCVCRGRVISKSRDRLEFKAPFWYIRGFVVRQLPAGLSRGVIGVQHHGHRLRLHCALSLFWMRLIASLFTVYVLVSVLVEGFLDGFRRESLYSLLLGIGVAWGFLYGGAWLIVFFRFKPFVLRAIYSPPANGSPDQFRGHHEGV